MNVFIWVAENGLHLFIQVSQKLLRQVISPVLFSRIGIKVTEDEANVIREQLCVILLPWVDLHTAFDLQQRSAVACKLKLRAKQKQKWTQIFRLLLLQMRLLFPSFFKSLAEMAAPCRTDEFPGTWMSLLNLFKKFTHCCQARHKSSLNILQRPYIASYNPSKFNFLICIKI